VIKKVVLVGMVAPVALFAISAKEVAFKVDKASSGFVDSISDMKMTLVDANGANSVRHMTNKRMEKPSGSDEEGGKSLMYFKSPSDVKGTALLTHEKIDRDDDQWLYLPALKRVKRISSKNKSGSFMGSEFSFEDLSGQPPEKFTYKGNAKKSKLSGKKVYVYDRFPKDKNSGYKKHTVYVDVKEFIVRKIDYYDRKNDLLKTNSIGNYHKVKGFLRPQKMDMKNLQTGKATTLEWLNEKLKNGLNARDFAKRVLKRR
jgi:hypothetical protein